MLGNRTEVPRLLSIFDIYVSTVHWAGLGRSLTEAMISGLPVIFTGVNGIPEIVIAVDTGLLISLDSPAKSLKILNTCSVILL